MAGDIEITELARDVKQKFELLYSEPMTAEQRWESIIGALWSEWNKQQRPLIAKAARAEAREACVQIAARHMNVDWEDGDGGLYGSGYENAAEEIVAAIRSMEVE